MLRKKLYYITHVDKANLFSTNGYVMVYYDEKCTKYYGKFDLESFYSYFKLDKHFKFIHKGGIYEDLCSSR